MSLMKKSIMSGDVNEVVNLLVNDSLTAKGHQPGAEVSTSTDLMCCICGGTVSVDDKWLKKATPLDLSKLACSDEHREELRQLRRDRHWS